MTISTQHNPALRVANLLAALAHAELPSIDSNGRTELSPKGARALRILIDLIFRLSAVSPTGSFAPEGLMRVVEMLQAAVARHTDEGYFSSESASLIHRELTSLERSLRQEAQE